MGFMLDTGTQYSVLNKACGPLNKEQTSVVQGATGTQLCSCTTKRKVDLGKHQVTHSFLVVPDSPAPLLGRDLLTKVGALIYFEPDEITVTDLEGSPIHILSLSLADEYRLFESAQEPGGDIAQWLKKVSHGLGRDCGNWPRQTPPSRSYTIEGFHSSHSGKTLSYAQRGSKGHSPSYPQANKRRSTAALSVLLEYSSAPHPKAGKRGL
jgi:hypothetical protein